MDSLASGSFIGSLRLIYPLIGTKKLTERKDIWTDEIRDIYKTLLMKFPNEHTSRLGKLANIGNGIYKFISRDLIRSLNSSSAIVTEDDIVLNKNETFI